MGKFIDLTGQKFGRLTVIKRVENNKYNQVQWLCKCECGNEKVITSSDLLSNSTNSCGCMPKKLKYDLTGKKFGRWTVLKLSQRRKGSIDWLCQCECGTVKEVRSSHLIKGKSLSCGCYEKELKTIHNLSNTRLYNIWQGIKKRCLKKYSKNYQNYGGRGITICDEWKNNFQAFYNWAYANGYDENAKRSECTIDRINVDGDYEPSNCRWSNAKEQANNRTNNKLLKYNNQIKTVFEWAKITGINAPVIYYRLSKGWNIEKILTTPVRKKLNT